MRNAIRMALLVGVVFLLSTSAVAGESRSVNYGLSCGAGMGYGWAHVANSSGGGSLNMEGDGLATGRFLVSWRLTERFAWGAEYLGWSLGDDPSHEIDLKMAAFNLTWFPENSAMYARAGFGWGRIETVKTIIADHDGDPLTPWAPMSNERQGDTLSILGSVGYLIYFNDKLALDLGMDIAFLKEIGGTEAHMGTISAGLHYDF